MHSESLNQKPAALTERLHISSSKRQRKMDKKLKFHTLSKLGNIQDKSKGPRIDNATSKATLAPQSSEKNYSNAAVERKDETEREKPKEKLEAEKHPTSILRFDNASNGDLRRKKKKKRKRRNPESPTITVIKINVQNDEAQASKTFRDFVHGFTDQPNIDHALSASKAAHEANDKQIHKDSAHGSGMANPLSELASTNSNSKLRGRRDRGSKRKPANSDSKAAPSVAVAKVKDHHS
jgi:hypothetical protein